MEFVEEYARAIAYVIKVMGNKGNQRLYDAHDVVHNVYLECGTVSVKKVRTKLLAGALHGVIHSCGSFSIIGQLYYGQQPTNFVYGEYDEKKCTKCKIPKIIILDFRRITTTRHFVPYSYYQSECIECEKKRKKVYQAKPEIKNKMNQYFIKLRERQAKELSDQYIKKYIVNKSRREGKRLMFSDITPQQIALTRQGIIAQRAKQINKGRNKTNE